MIVAYSYVPILDERAGAAFARAMSRRGRLVEGFDGFLRFEFRRECGKEKRFVIATWWRSRSDLQHYLSSDAHRSTHSRLTPEQRRGLGDPVVRIHEVLEVSENRG